MSERADSQLLGGTALVVTTPAGLEGDARRELCKLLPGAFARSLFLKGNLLLLSDIPEAQALARIAAAETRCVARVVAVQRCVEASADHACFSRIAAAAADVGRLHVGESFLVRCRRRGRHGWASRELERAVARELEGLSGAVGEYEVETDWRVSVEVYQALAYVGVNRPSELLRKSLRKQRKYAPGERPLNRAEWKIREALEAFGIELAPGARVLDLGSAPGGWASVLADLAQEVVAVDPAELDPEVAGRANVRHLRCRAEALAGRGDVGEEFDLLTCDMNVDPVESAQIMCGLAGLLRPGAPAIMTVKCTTRWCRRHEREARAALAEQYQEIRMRRLPHNARETTAAMRRKDG